MKFSHQRFLYTAISKPSQVNLSWFHWFALLIRLTSIIKTLTIGKKYTEIDDCKYTLCSKKEATKLLAITFSNLSQFSQFFHC